MGKLTLLLLALLVWLQYSLWFGKNGLHDYTRVNDDVTAQQATNAKLKARNDQLFAEIDDLNGGQEAIEERARNELSMTRPGETFYRLVPDASKRNQHRGNSRTIDNRPGLQHGSHFSGHLRRGAGSRFRPPHANGMPETISLNR